jgi:hypothetical protein
VGVELCLSQQEVEALLLAPLLPLLVLPLGRLGGGALL